jgi:hypothetical protein
MQKRKERLTVTVDSAYLRAATEAVAAGRAASLSGWVNLADRAEKDRRWKAMAAAVAAYETGSGAIGEEEIEAQSRADRRDAIIVRGGRRISRPRPRRKIA